jgi:hypothetical protein
VLTKKTPVVMLSMLAGAIGLLALAPSAEAVEPDGSSGRSVSAPRAPATTKRLVVTYASSITTAPRTASAITVVNDAGIACDVRVEYYFGFSPSPPACSLTTVVASGVAHDFCSRDLPFNLTTCNSVCSGPLTFFEGKAIVYTNSAAACARIRANPRQYYTTGTTSDTGVAGVTSVNVAGP